MDIVRPTGFDEIALEDMNRVTFRCDIDVFTDLIVRFIFDSPAFKLYLNPVQAQLWLAGLVYTI